MNYMQCNILVKSEKITAAPDIAAPDMLNDRASAVCSAKRRKNAAQSAFEHFPAKWEPIRRRKGDHTKENRANSD